MGRTLPNMLALPFGEIYTPVMARTSSKAFACSKSRTLFAVRPQESGRPDLDHSRVLGGCVVDICCSSYPHGNCWPAGSFGHPTLVRWFTLYYASHQGWHHFGPGVPWYEVIFFTITRCIHSWPFLALTVYIDSYFWDHWPLWPEFSGIYFNIYEGKSAEWGVSILRYRNIISFLTGPL